VFDRERIVEGPAATSASANGTSISPEHVKKDTPKPPLASKRKDDMLIREEYNIKCVHYHREIPVTNPAPAIVAVEQEPRPLKVEEIPPLQKAAATGALNDLNELLDAGEKIDKLLPFEAVLRKADTNLHVGGCTALHLAAFFGRPK
jgi:hypothetical protein